MAIGTMELAFKPWGFHMKTYLALVCALFFSCGAMASVSQAESDEAESGALMSFDWLGSEWSDESKQIANGVVATAVGAPWVVGAAISLVISGGYALFIAGLGLYSNQALPIYAGLGGVIIFEVVIGVAGGILTWWGRGEILEGIEAIQKGRGNSRLKQVESLVEDKRKREEAKRRDEEARKAIERVKRQRKEEQEFRERQKAKDSAEEPASKEEEAPGRRVISTDDAPGWDLPQGESPE